MNKICLIHHPIGIGDIFFLQYIGRKYLELGYKVIWPIRNDILWIKDYIPDITFCLPEDNFPGKEYYGQDLIINSPNFVYLGLKKAHMWNDKYTHIMKSKYSLLNLDWTRWHEGFIFNRNIEKEMDLYYNILGLTDDTKYVFWNNMASVDTRTCDVIDNLKFDYPKIALRYIDGYSLFDWCKVFENAAEIHTVHTGVNYLIDKLNIRANVYNMYQGLHALEVQHIPFVKKPKFIPN